MQVGDAVYYYTVAVPRIRWTDTGCAGMFGHKYQHTSIVRAIRRHGTARHGTTRHGTTRHGTTQHDTARHVTARYAARHNVTNRRARAGARARKRAILSSPKRRASVAL
ncbi:hypothetical protein ALC62_13871 [Cyphomyrmex costatus]|uniref:Uncharacterized protein n=1 Tax=Cyphomyrmex costatus TaxID=456900 RepID=A0A195C5J4_9HYME|nr:hypothetical protein ALC62_13871 [Cyphomyrmex costatus]